MLLPEVVDRESALQGWVNKGEGQWPKASGWNWLCLRHHTDCFSEWFPVCKGSGLRPASIGLPVIGSRRGSHPEKLCTGFSARLWLLVRHVTRRASLLQEGVGIVVSHCLLRKTSCPQIVVRAGGGSVQGLQDLQLWPPLPHHLPSRSFYGCVALVKEIAHCALLGQTPHPTPFPLVIYCSPPTGKLQFTQSFNQRTSLGTSLIRRLTAHPPRPTLG